MTMMSINRLLSLIDTKNFFITEQLWQSVLIMKENESKEPIDVTLGICLRNSERTIKDTLTSVLNQSFAKKHMEVIIIDDGCTDRTIPIVSEFFSKADLLFKIYSTGGGGLTKARQLVIDKSCSFLVAFVDGDMVLSRDFLQKQVKIMKNNPSIGVAQGTMKGLRSKSSVAELEALSSSDSQEIGIQRNWRQNPQALGTGGSIFRVAAMIAVGGFDNKIKGAAEDADLTARIKSAGYSLIISEAEFEHEFKKTLQSLWKQYVWYGYGMHYFYHKHGKLNGSLFVYFLPITFAWNLLRSILIFKATRRKIAFFLPAYNFFRATAWWFGFFRAHAKGYGH
jgi:cellulose synthase/poly-beta-1,6-N-acetylglucosamine synthase-like glycosyltransferase